ncbi:MAG TPA: hypothetical protein VN029_04525 [Sphingomonas sp.]|nr:hypothetical protein [Sphingomonas sp.]
MTPAEAASPAPVYIVLALLMLALVVIADWLDTAPIDPPWAEDDDSDDGP